ncbi:hypothetical protein [Vulcanococcus limneticus]|uniref:hypothetical protein n=1 Tax=Vulcanococcus limneticus TaxID=2170428 RepID=UPI000B98112A|nr:hypothetical protein [Vulcanococcus limneticus]MCP9792448.1 hypothetical protein [Vulcanococcus limneticus MW73D5]MCP9894129.1 hypothetical protein [Vulcanococcus limneticus Candia 3F8]MCP9897828.1 hypothetical protein [Vulcanococcus limneticus Candia 3B3]
MAADPLDALRLALMQDVLPMGMAVVERARRSGPQGVVEVFTAGGDPLAQLKQEGEPAARGVRENLDRLQPGLGNPVIKVSVQDVPAESSPSSGSTSSGSSSSGSASSAAAQATGPERAVLQATLARIDARLRLLEQRLELAGGEQP